MITAVELATWIALCIPWAEPRLATALVIAGSGGRPYLISSAKSDISDQPYQPSMVVLAKAKGTDPTQYPAYIGLTQVPIRDLPLLNLSPDMALDKCTNLQVGYLLFEKAYALAEKTEKSPWKRTSAAFNIYRDQQPLIESEYSNRAIDYLMNKPFTAPARMTDPVYHAVLAEWSAGLAQRHAKRTTPEQPSMIEEAIRIATWARMKS